MTAAAIIAWRDANGRFGSVDQLGDVDGIGPARLDKLRDHVRCDDGDARIIRGYGPRSAARPRGADQLGGDGGGNPVGRPRACPTVAVAVATTAAAGWWGARRRRTAPTAGRWPPVSSLCCWWARASPSPSPCVSTPHDTTRSPAPRRGHLGTVTPTETPRVLAGARMMFRGSLLTLDGAESSGDVVVFASGADYSSRSPPGSPPRSAPRSVSRNVGTSPSRCCRRTESRANVLRSRLSVLMGADERPEGPLAVLACMPGEQHEFGLMATSIVLSRLGWRTCYLGANTPTAELAITCRTLRPAVVVVAAHRATAFAAHAPALRRVATSTTGTPRRALAPPTRSPSCATRRRLDGDPVRGARTLHEALGESAPHDRRVHGCLIGRARPAHRARDLHGDRLVCRAQAP